MDKNGGSYQYSNSKLEEADKIARALMTMRESEGWKILEQLANDRLMYLTRILVNEIRGSDYHINDNQGNLTSVEHQSADNKHGQAVGQFGGISFLIQEMEKLIEEPKRIRDEIAKQKSLTETKHNISGIKQYGKK